jgi:hypothetical protein
MRSHTTRALRLDLESSQWQITWKDVGKIVGALAGLTGAMWSYEMANAETDPSEDEKMVLPADPWMLTNEKPKMEEKKRLSLPQRFAQFLWRVFRWVSGIAVAEIILRALARMLHDLRENSIEKVLSKLLSAWTQNSAFASPIDPHLIAEELASYISEFSGTQSSYAGILYALNKDTLEKLPNSLFLLQKERYRPLDGSNWTQPFVSTHNYEEILLSPQFTSFLAESKQDGTIYLLEGYFGALGSEKRSIPLLMCYSKVSDSLEAFKEGKVLESWKSRLNASRVVGKGCDAVKDMSMEYRAAYLVSDIDRLLSDEDWVKYLGTSKTQIVINREKSKTAQWDKWSISGPLGTIYAQIEFGPRALATQIEIIFPETEDTLEHRTTLSPTTVMCSRWCNYAEQHPVLSEALGTNVKMVSPPTTQNSIASGSDFDGALNETWFTCGGTKGQLSLHFKTGRDQSQDGRSPITPTLAVWAETDTGNRIDIYENPRERFKQLSETGKTIPVVVSESQLPFLASNLHVVERPAP